MKYQDLKNNLRNNVGSLYLLFGEDFFLIENSLRLIKEFSNIEMPEINIANFVEGDIDAIKITRELETSPAFSDRKLVYLDLSTKQCKLLNESELNNYSANPNLSSILVINIGTMPRSNKIDWARFTEVDCSRLNDDLLIKYVISQAKKFGCTIESGAVNKLIEYTLGDLTSINSELMKICNFVGDKNKIDVGDIESNVQKSLEYQIYELTDSLGKKDIERVFSIIQDIKLGGKPKSKDASASQVSGLRGLMPLIYNHFRRLFYISLNSYSKAEYSKYLKVQEYAVTKASAQVKFFSTKKLKEILDLCAKLDFDIKESNVLEQNAIEILCLYIINN